MSLLVVGLDHRSAPVRLLERATVPPAEVPHLLGELLGGTFVTEAAVLSTCNRVEVYADVAGFHGGLNEIGLSLAGRTGMPLAALAEHLYVHYADEAVRHVFTVAAGLGSMVVGEAQVLGQLREAYAMASGQNATGRALHDLFQQGLRVGKRVHAETDIDRAGRNVMSAALALGERTVGPVAGRPAVVVGAGSMGALAAGTLRRVGIGPLVLANRTPARAARLAATVEAEVAGLDDLPGTLTAADVVVCATTSTTAVLTVGAVAAAQRARGGRPLLVLDLAVPRDAERGVEELPGVTLVDMERLGAALTAAGESIVDGVEDARSIVEAEIAAFLARQRRSGVAPTVVALRAHAAEVVAAELDRLAARLPDVDPVVRAELERTVRRVVSTLLHQPTVRVKEFAGTPGGDRYALALSELFGLDTAAAPTTAALPVPAVPPVHEEVS